MPVPLHALAIAFAGLLLNSCNHSSLTVHADSTAGTAAHKDTTADLILQASEIRTISGDTILLSRGEWYAWGEFADLDPARNMLLFLQDNGKLHEISSFPWSRTGKMQLANGRSIDLIRGAKYEFIYYFQFDNPDLNTDMPSGFYIRDITTAGSYFISPGRYKPSPSRNLPAACNGRFVDDLNGGLISVTGSGARMNMKYAASRAAQATNLEIENITGTAFRSRLPGKSEVIFRFHDGEWILSDQEGTRRIFRPETPEVQ